MQQPVKRTYNNALLASERWNDFTLRPDDVVVATPYKSGTAWMQNIVLHLIFQDLKLREIPAFSPWLDMRPRDFGEIRALLAAQTHRRCIKTHLPFESLALRHHTFLPNITGWQ